MTGQNRPRQSTNSSREEFIRINRLVRQAVRDNNTELAERYRQARNQHDPAVIMRRLMTDSAVREEVALYQKYDELFAAAVKVRRLKDVETYRVLRDSLPRARQINVLKRPVRRD